MAASDLVANALCLELVNTVNNWHDPGRDALGSPGEAVVWATAVGLPLTGRPDDDALGRATTLRASVRAVFGSLAEGRRPDDADLAAVEHTYTAGLGRARLTGAGATYRFQWPAEGDLDDLLAQVAASAVELLTTGPLERVGECPSCGWLFVDTSRNGRRRWCSMDTCGARVKARRHYAATRGGVHS